MIDKHIIATAINRAAEGSGEDLQAMEYLQKQMSLISMEIVRIWNQASADDYPLFVFCLERVLEQCRQLIPPSGEMVVSMLRDVFQTAAIVIDKGRNGNGL